MKRLSLHRVLVIAWLALSAISFQIDGAGAGEMAGGSGDLWEVTTKISMEGAPMGLPAQKSKVCAPKEWNEPPGGMDKRQKCQTSDFKVDGTKATWKVICAGPPEMTGEGEIVRDGAEAYTGSIQLKSSEGNMTIRLNGKRLGDCDPAQK